MPAPGCRRGTGRSRAGAGLGGQGSGCGRAAPSGGQLVQEQQELLAKGSAVTGTRCWCQGNVHAMLLAP